MPTAPKSLRPAKRKGSSHGKRKRGRWAQSMRVQLMAECNHQCAACGEVKLPKDLEMDHVLPIEHGGEDARENLQMLCTGCHDAKTADERNRRGFEADGTPLRRWSISNQTGR